MLGTIEQTHVVELLDAIASQDGKRVLACVADLDERVPDYHGVLAEIAAILQRVALIQAIPDFALDEADDAEALQRLAQAFTPEDVQLNYQIALVGRRDLDMAPDARGGFEMVLLRMLAFQPAREGNGEAPTAPVRSRPTTAARAASVSQSTAPATVTQKISPPTRRDSGDVADKWAQIVSQLGLQGPVSQLAAHCSLVSKDGAVVRLMLDPNGEPFRRPTLEDKLTQALTAHFGETIKLDIEVGAGPQSATIDTPAKRQQAQVQDKLQAAKVAIENDPNVQAMRDIFGATVQPESIKPN
jgi:DNA polymerase-3 subunit gamma/tau